MDPLKDLPSINQAVAYNSYDYCSRCKLQKLEGWCELCERKHFQSNFSNWTSGNEYVDGFIRETQLSATTKFNFLEWIPYDRLVDFKHIGAGGFGIVFSARWLDGPRTNWNAEESIWERYPDAKVALKRLNIKEEDVTSELFKELQYHLKSSKLVVGRINTLRLYGMSYDPESKAYIMVMILADEGDLGAYLKSQFPSLNYTKRLDLLYDIATGLLQIHQSGLVHRDLHSGNVMCLRYRGKDHDRDDSKCVIGDFGLATPQLKHKDKKIFGVMPYVAPEVLGGDPYTQAADIYSFGILMWEITSGVKALADVAHDKSLALKIYSGGRPRIIPNTPKLYVDLMEKCWDGDKEKRPNAHELYVTIGFWLNQCLHCPTSDVAKEFALGDKCRLSELQLQILHPSYSRHSKFHNIISETVTLEL